MPEIKYSLNFDFGNTFDITKIINAQVLPQMSQAVDAIGQATASKWQEAVYKAKLWQGEKQAYANSIKWVFKQGEMHGYVEAAYKYAQEIETGRPARDLKKMLETSPKVRRTKDGRKFLVIPFRHNTTGNNALSRAMPQFIYNMAQNMGKSHVTGAGLRPTGEVTLLSRKFGMKTAPVQTPFLYNPKSKKHSMTAKMSYAWGGRLTHAALLQAGATAEQAKRYAGMVRMETSTPGGSKSSSYLTFRVMMEGSQGWITKPQAGKKIAESVTNEMRPLAERIFQEAAKRIV